MFEMNAKANPDEYVEHMGIRVKVGRYHCVLHYEDVESSSGSSAKGFKFHTRRLGYLSRVANVSKYFKPTMYSFDHGKSWAASIERAKKEAMRSKVTLALETRKEFAYDTIQSINEKYY